MSSQSINITQTFQLALRHHQAGRLQQAEGIYQQILKVDPNNPYANHFLGVIAYQFGRIETAVKLISKSINAKPDYAEAYNNLGVAFFDLGEFDKAIASYQRALTNNPEYAEAHNNLGNALKKSGKVNEAVASYQKALAIRNDFAEAFYNLGDVQHDLGNINEAIDCYQQALAISPDYAEAYNNLGNAFLDKGHLTESESCYQKALDIKPNYAEALNNMGNLLEKKNQLHSAVHSYQKALVIDPDYAEAYYNLARVQDDLGRTDEAERGYQRAIAIKPDYGEAYNNLGTLYKKQGLLNKAVESFKKAILIKPDYAEAYNNLGNALLELGFFDETENSFQKAIAIKPDYPEAYNNLGCFLQQQGNIGKALESFQKVISLKADYSEAHLNLGSALSDCGLMDDAIASYRTALSIKPDYQNAHSNLLFSLNYFPDISQKEIYQESLQWDAQHARGLLPGKLVFSTKRKTKHRLRIGYVSPDFRTHSVAYFFEPLLRAHNRKQVELFCYANVMKPDQVTHRLQSVADHWCSIVGKNDAEVAEQIRRDKIDILVDLAGHSANNRLLIFAHKPAPVQVTWLGYPNTTGMDAIDYRFTDEIADPIGKADSLHSEELVRLKHGFLCYQAAENASNVAPLPGLEKDHITFGSFNNLTKTTGKVVKLWAEILRAVPASRLILKAKQLADAAIVKKYQQMFADQGIAAERLKFYGRLPSTQEHLDLYSKVDIGLDPFPYNGTTTTCEALWMGVPVVTMAGERHAGRVGASIMHHIGLPDLVAENVDSYVDLAVNLANDWEKLSGLRAGLRERLRNSVLCDAGGFAATVEDAYLAMWEKYISGQG